MADRVKQADEAKVGNTGKSNYDLFGGYDVARQEAMDKFKGTEKKTPAEEFAGKFWSKLIGSKLVKAIDTYAEEKGIGWADKQTLVSEYINTIRKPVLTGADVKAAYKEDTKMNAEPADFSNVLRAWYKQLEPFGIKVEDAPTEPVTEEKKPATGAKKSIPKKDNGMMNGIPIMVSGKNIASDWLSDEELKWFTIKEWWEQKSIEDKYKNITPSIINDWKPTWFENLTLASLHAGEADIWKRYQNETDPLKKELLYNEWKKKNKESIDFWTKLSNKSKDADKWKILRNIKYQEWLRNKEQKNMDYYKSNWLEKNIQASQAKLSIIDKEIARLKKL